MLKKLRSNRRLGKVVRDQAIPSRTTVPTLDRILSGIASVSQVGLLVLAGYGYIYTVLPVYQKALLDEEIAKKTLELNKKELELQIKNAELNELNAAVSQARESALQSQKEVGKLKGTVREQYSELQPRLLQEFELLGSKLCRLKSIPDGGFSICIRDNVLSTVNLSGLKAGDRKLLQKIVDHENNDIHATWREYLKTAQEKKHKAEVRKSELSESCEQKKASEEYKDKMKQLMIDYQCSVDSITSHFELEKIEGEINNFAYNLVATRLNQITRDFYAKAPPP